MFHLPRRSLTTARGFSQSGTRRRGLKQGGALFLLGVTVAIAVPADDPAWNLGAYARVTDKLFLMAYDEHYQGGDPGAIASQRWFEAVVARAARTVPPATRTRWT